MKTHYIFKSKINKVIVFFLLISSLSFSLNSFERIYEEKSFKLVKSLNSEAWVKKCMNDYKTKNRYIKIRCQCFKEEVFKIKNETLFFSNKVFLKFLGNNVSTCSNDKYIEEVQKIYQENLNELEKGEEKKIKIFINKLINIKSALEKEKKEILKQIKTL